MKALPEVISRVLKRGSILASFVWVCAPALASGAADTASIDSKAHALIMSTLNRVANHQIHALGDGPLSPESTASEIRKIREPRGIVWAYPWGVTLYGLLRSTDVTHDTKIRDFVLEHNRLIGRDYSSLAERRAKLGMSDMSPLGSQIDGLLKLGTLDNCGSMGAAILEGMLRDPGSATDEEGRVVARVADWIVRRQDRLPNGVLWRSDSNGEVGSEKPGTIWLDDLYMACPFLVRWSQYRADRRFLDDAAAQIIGMAALLQDTDGVWFHGYYVPAKKHSPFKWGRANGWAVVAEVEVLSALPENSPSRPQLLSILRRHLAGLQRLQSPTGFWHQVLDHQELWEETSCTAMFAYGFARAANRGWIEPQGKQVALRAFEAVESRISPEGLVEGSCEGTSIGLDLGYYAKRRQLEDGPHGRGAVLLAGTELLSPIR